MRFRLRTMLILIAMLAISVGAAVKARDRWYVYPGRAALHAMQKQALLALAIEAEQDAELCRGRAAVCRRWVVASAEATGARGSDASHSGWPARVAEWERLATRCARLAAERTKQAAEHARWERYYLGGW